MGTPSSVPTFSVNLFTPSTRSPSLPSNSSTENSLKDLQKSQLDASVIVLFTVLFLIFLLVAGLVFFSRWDGLDRKILLYVPPKKGRSIQGTKSLAELAASRRIIDDAFLAGCGQIDNSIVDDTEDEEFAQRRRWIRNTYQVLRCCVPKSEDLSILIAGNILPRFLHALRRHHPWLWFFFEGSRKSTRVMRFVITFKFVLTSLFVTTVLYDINYPSAETCSNLNHQASACKGSPSNILTKAPICTYNDSADLCTLRSPPDDPAFLILVAFLTVIVMIPFNVIFTLVLTLLCSKRPRVEALGLDPIDWLGSADPVANKRAASAAEESERLLAVVRSIHGALFHYCERTAEGFCGPDERKGMDYVLRRLGLVIREDRIELSNYSKLWWTGVNEAIRYRVQCSLKDAREIQLNMEQYSEISQRESYLIQHFLLSRLSFLYRVSLSRYFAHWTRDLPHTIHPIPWLLGWLFIIASLIFFIAWILYWGNAHAHSSIIANWGFNIALINFQEVVIFSVARIFFTNVLAIETIRPQLKNIHKYLIKNAEERSRSRRRTKSDEDKHFLLQYLDPLLWAAKLSGSRGFANMPDSELSKLSSGAPVSFDYEVYEEEGEFSSVIKIEPGREL